MTDSSTTPLTESEFVRRFVNFAVEAIGATFTDGHSVADYAREVAHTHWADPDQRKDGPETCAEGEIECWRHG